MKTQANSFACKICEQIFTEESGAYKGFICEHCESAKILNRYNKENHKEETIKTIKRHLKGIEKAVEKLEKE